MHRQVVKGKRETYYRIIHTGGNAGADNGNAVRGEECQRVRKVRIAMGASRRALPK